MEAGLKRTTDHTSVTSCTQFSEGERHDCKLRSHHCIRPRLPEGPLDSWSSYIKRQGIFSVEGRGIDAAMDKALKGYKLPIESIRSDLRITRKRSRGERPYSVLKRTFRGGHTYVTTVPRVRVKAMFLCLGHNLFNLLSLTRRTFRPIAVFSVC